MQTPGNIGTREDAWRQPTFSAESIDADKWTAVYLPIPENADTLLLNDARVAVVECLREASEYDPSPDPPPEWTRDMPNAARFWNSLPGEDVSAAEARIVELNARLQIGHSRWTGEPLGDQEPMTIEAIARDPWAAITNPMPEAPSDELLKVAREAVNHCLDELKPGSDRYEGAMGRLAEIESTMWAGVAQNTGQGQKP